MKRYNKCLFYCYKDFWINIISVIIILIICFILYIGCFIKFSFFDRYSGLVLKDGDYYVSILVDNSWFDLHNGSLVLDKKNKEYSIVKIASEYSITDSGLRKEVLLKFLIDDDDKIVNNVLNLYFVRKMTFFERIKEMVIWKS